ncbi:MAG: FhaA domain-containing protein [Actinomycetes bacterium]|jgi:hypothetical protein|nr:DUF3662 and FHA domain-containing protein [Candidatus Nanopelagicales bacterium]MDP4824882.1 DUF3662 and FHA domain-containing protein [Candidatus Nanopelagicales bacterium]
MRAGHYDQVVGLLDRFEDRLDRMVNGAFARAFKAEVQPVEIAAALQKEMDDRAAVVTRGRTVVPNLFITDLSPTDDDRLSVYRDTLERELATLVTDYVEQQGYTVLGPIQVELARDDSLETGIFRVHSEARMGVSADSPAPLPGQPTLTDGLTHHPLIRNVTKLGRGHEADIRIDDPGVSRVHCEVVVGAPTVVRDLGSTNGLSVDGSRVTQATLVDGSTVTIGQTTLVYRSG